MEESDIEGLATHGGPEPCAGARKSAGEALAGGVQAGLWSREIKETGVPTPSMGRKATPRMALARANRGPRAVRDPWHVRKLHVREPGEPIAARALIRRGPLGEG